MRVLIIGLNGLIGPSIAHHASAHGHIVFGMGRSANSNSISDAFYVSGNRSDPKQILHTTIEHKIDVVVDVIPMVIGDTQPLLDCLDGVIDQYVMISSSDVYANYELLHRRATGDPILKAVDEDSPLRSTRHPYREKQPRLPSAPDQYLDDYDKIPIEHATRKLSSAWTILRLPMVYGPGDKQKRFRWAIACMLRGNDTLVVPRGWANWQSTYGYVENVGAAVAITLGHQQARNQVFNIAEETVASQLEWARKFANTAAWRGAIELTDDPNDSFAQRLSGLNLNVPFKIDGTRLRQTFGFSDVIDGTTALVRTIESEAVP